MFASYIAAFWELAFGSTGQLPDQFHGSGNLVFAFVAGLMGLVTVFLDWVLVSIGKRSILKLAYGKSVINILRLFVLWGIGAGVGGFLGASIGIFQFTRIASIGVGVAWPLILPRLLEKANEDFKEDEQSNGE